jgi:hypothetical protein
MREYRITIREQLDDSWSGQLDNLKICPDPENKGTVLTGQVRDQAALRSVLNKLFNFGLTLVGLESGDIPQSKN